MREWLAVALGGMLGALTRHVVTWLLGHVGVAWLPIATLACNVGGCFAIGLLAEWAHFHASTREWWVVGVRVGLLGGLTTYSAFALDVVRLWQENRTMQSSLFVLAHVIFGVLAVYVGVLLARQWHVAEASQ